MMAHILKSLRTSAVDQIFIMKQTAKNQLHFHDSLPVLLLRDVGSALCHFMISYENCDHCDQ